MVGNRTAEEIYRFIVNDFRGAWNSISANSVQDIGRGNFMFARQAMNLLEFAGMLCKQDSDALRNFSDKLNEIEPRYFIKLPRPCVRENSINSDYHLPDIGSGCKDNLLSMLFDLVRHGLAHQYQQIIVKLNDSTEFFVSFTGADHILIDPVESPLREQHLLSLPSDSDIGLQVLPDVLFLDFDRAIQESNLLTRGLQFNHLSRPANLAYYDFSRQELLESLSSSAQN